MDWVSTQLDNCMVIPSKTGWSPLPNGFRNYLLEMQDGRGLATDSSAFDWTWKDWMVREVMRCKLQQCRSTPRHLAIYKKVVMLRFTQLLGPNARIQFPSGEIFRQNFYGFMKSGWLLTISLNGDCQVVTNALAWIRYWDSRNVAAPPFPRIWVMGDDVRMKIPADFEIEDYVEELKTTGLVVKDWSESHEFAGFTFGGTLSSPIVEPNYPQKHKWMLAHTPKEQLPESLTQMSMLYSLSKQTWLDELQQKYVPQSLEVFRAWAFGLPCARIRVPTSLWTWED